MRELSGVEAIVQIRKEFRGAKIIVLTSYHGDEEIYRALQAGARGYLLKDTLHEHLLAALRDVYAGKMCIPSEIAGRLARRLPQSDLTGRELEILRLIVRGLSNKEIGARLKIAEGTVKNHVINIFGKLGVSDRTEAATSALERGIIQPED
jgi:two-component system NarL family response regulator